jgi:hypothetical protein
MRTMTAARPFGAQLSWTWLGAEWPSVNGAREMSRPLTLFRPTRCARSRAGYVRFLRVSRRVTVSFGAGR